MSSESLPERIFEAFEADAAATPSVTLRGAYEIDAGRPAPPFEPTADQASDIYLERHWQDLPFLDAASWRYYLPFLMVYALRHVGVQSNVVDGLLAALRPPDRVPPRLGSLTTVQESVVSEVLDILAFDEQSLHRELACQVLEEWWLAKPLFRPPPGNEA